MVELDAIGEDRGEDKVGEDKVGVVVDEVVNKGMIGIEVSWDVYFLLSLCGFSFSAESWSLDLLLGCGDCDENT